MKGNAGIHQEMVFALQLRQDRVMRARKTDILFLGKHYQAGEGPFQPLGCKLLRRIVAEEYRDFNVRTLNTAKGIIHFIPAAANDNTRGKDRHHKKAPLSVSYLFNPFYFTGIGRLCKESHWQKSVFDAILYHQAEYPLNEHGRRFFI